VPAGFAIPVWEAQWKGRPVVVGTGGGLPSQIVDGVTGLVAGHDGGFVEAILGLVQDPSRVDRLGAAGRRMVQQRYLITRFLADVLRLLAALLNDAPPSSRQQTQARV